MEKLTVDKNNLQDLVRDKEDDIRIMRDPAGLKTFETLQTELEFYIKDLSSQKDEQSLALKGLKLFMDQMTQKRQSRQVQLCPDKPSTIKLEDSDDSSEDETIKEIKYTINLKEQ